MCREYNPIEIEKKWQNEWEKRNIFKNDLNDNTKEKYYILEMFAYPSGDLHLGHLRNYTIGDAIARYKKMKGFNVFHPFGWDSFGLPAENAALDNGIHPKIWTEKNIEKMKSQLKKIGISYNFDHEISTYKKEYYKFNQELFIKMYEKGLVYKKKSYVNWCPECNTVLANEQVEQGKCWRHSKVDVVQKELSQWYFKITDYAEELLTGHKELENNWPSEVLSMQKNWIGKSIGAEVIFEYENYKIPVFTTRPDTIYGVSYIVLAPEHELVKNVFLEKNKEISDIVYEMINEDKISRTSEDKEKNGVFTGFYATHPLTKEKVQIWIANYVLIDYGTGAVMGVPAHDERDNMFAKKYNLPIKDVNDGEKLINSDKFDGLLIEDAKIKIIEELEKLGLGKKDINYRLHDWLISRQRYWGTPIPVLYDEDGNIHLEKIENLPIELPDDIDFSMKKNPLETSESFKYVTYNGVKYRRETDTMDTFVDSSWYFLRYLDPNNKDIVNKELANKFTPVDKYIGGIEHAVMHLLYSRFIYKVLRDLGYVNNDEPFKSLLPQGMVLAASYYDPVNRKYLFKKDVEFKDNKPYSKDGVELVSKVEKMSKSKNNGIKPSEIADTYGADSARLFALFAAPVEKELEWKEQGVQGAYRFINRLFILVNETKDIMYKTSGEINYLKRSKEDENLQRKLHQTIKKVTESMEDNFRFNTAIASIMELLNMITSYKQNVLDKNNISSETYKIWKDCLLNTILLISPFSPHASDEMLEIMGENKMAYEMDWPSFNEELAKEDNITIVVQINGKLRDEMNVSIDISEDEVKEIALNSEKIKKYIENQNIVKMIYIPKKLLNIVVK